MKSHLRRRLQQWKRWLRGQGLEFDSQHPGVELTIACDSNSREYSALFWLPQTMHVHFPGWKGRKSSRADLCQLLELLVLDCSGQRPQAGMNSNRWYLPVFWISCRHAVQTAPPSTTVLLGPSAEITRSSKRTPPVRVFGVGVPGPLAAAGTVASTQTQTFGFPSPWQWSVFQPLVWYVWDICV